MSSQVQTLKNDNDLKSKFKTEIINPSKNEYWILIENEVIDYEFKFPLQSNQFHDFEKNLAYANVLKYGLKFRDCTFKKDLTLYKHVTEERDIYINNCNFESTVNLRDYHNVITFEDCKFYSIISAENSKLSGKVKFWKCHFYDFVNFRNTKFIELVDFWRSTFHMNTIFYKTDFMNTVVFSAVTFKENVLFTYSLINKLILLRGTKIEKGFDLSLAIIYGKLGLFGFNLENYKDYEFITDEDEYEEAVSNNAIIPIINKRETFRILKDNLESQKNLSESLKFKAIEKEVLREELNNTKLIHSDNSIFSKIRNKVNNILEILNLELNKYSNDFGSSYGRAFLFIVIVGWIWFYLSLLSTINYSFSINPNDWEFREGLRFFIEFLNPLHKVDYLKDYLTLSTWFYVLDFVGRILVGYGIYQFIQAFRKYK